MQHVTKTAAAKMTSHGGVGVAKEVRTAHALRLVHFRFQVAGVERACVRADVTSGGGDAVLEDVVEAARLLNGGGRQLGRRQLRELGQRAAVLASAVTAHTSSRSANQRRRVRN